MKIDPKQQKRSLALRGNHFRYNLTSLSLQALSILDQTVKNTVLDAVEQNICQQH